jgi:glutathione-specific gamma-glutamylcyclotransferase
MMPKMTASIIPLPAYVRDPAPMLDAALRQWGGNTDLWIFGYASLIWRPEFDYTERRLARVHGWHRALQMTSRVNRGTPDNPGLVFAMLTGGSCLGVVFKIPQKDGREVLSKLWHREMPTGVYDPRWVTCSTDAGTVRALAFTLPRKSPNFAGALQAQQYAQIFSSAVGRYGSTRDYALQTYLCLRNERIEDKALRRILDVAGVDISSGRY